MKKTFSPYALFFVLVLITACNSKPDFNFFYYSPEQTAVLAKTLNLPELPDDYTIELPIHLRNAGLAPSQVERDKAILGRVLFYDKKLSKDGTISCGSCHKQNLGFGDDRQFSLGVNNQVGERNSIALYSVASFAAYYGTDINGASAIPFFWDNRAATAKEQSMGSLTNPIEMDLHMTEVADAVRNQDYYQPLFEKAYGDNSVTSDRVLESIANFVNAMGSYSSKFDVEASKAGLYSPSQYSNTFSGFTATENAGKGLFMQHCATCHSHNMGRPPLTFANNGLYQVYTDQGVGGETNIASQKGTFKIPTLRNIAVSAPYMHDGSLKTLEDVIEHYNSGIKPHANLHTALKASNGTPKKNFLNIDQKAQLIAFLNTLTDYQASADTRFSNPFKQ
jgi:cytochrome c peroxidase